MSPHLVILMGIPGSGKSTFATTQFSAYRCVGMDLLKKRPRETAAFEAAVAEGVDIIVDNTNPEKSDRQRYIPKAKAAGYRISGFFLRSKITDCRRRNALRTGKACVPNVAIFSISAKLELPSLEEGFDELFFVEAKDNGVFEVSPWNP